MIRLYIYSVVLKVSNVKDLLSFISSNLNEKRLQNSYEVALFNSKMKIPVIGKCIVSGVCDEVELQKFVMRLSVILHVIHYVHF